MSADNFLLKVQFQEGYCVFEVKHSDIPYFESASNFYTMLLKKFGESWFELPNFKTSQEADAYIAAEYQDPGNFFEYDPEERDLSNRSWDPFVTYVMMS